MTTSARKQVVLDRLVGGISGSAWTNVSKDLTLTATMQNGSLLKADLTEAAVADAAVVKYVVDCPQIELFEAGDTFFASLAYQDVKLNSNALHFSDAAYDGETLTLLEAARCQFAAVTTVTE